MMTAKRLVSVAATAAGMASVVVAMMTVGDSSVAAAPPPSGPQSVLVVNTSDSPVPTVATGTTAVSGEVSIANTVTAHLDSNQVVVDDTTPLSVRDADGGLPVAALVQFTVPQFASGAGGRYTVPAGKRLIIEYASGRVVGGAADDHQTATVEWGGGSGGAFQRQYLIPTALGGDDRLYSAPLRMYFGPQEFVDVRVSRTVPGTTLNADFNITGRLVDVP